MYVFIPVDIQVGAVVTFAASQVCVWTVVSDALIFEVSVEDTFVPFSLLVISVLLFSNVVVTLRGKT